MPSNALQMVNRVLRNLGDEDVTGFAATNRSQVVLDHLNTAARNILESRVWEFDIRHDGVLKTKEVIDSNTNGISTTINDATVTFIGSSSDTIPINNDNVWRLIISDDSKWPNTAFKITERTGLSAVPPNATHTFETELQWHATQAASRTGKVVSYEFMLPSTVRAVMSARHQEQEIRLREIDESLSFNDLVPRPHDRQGDPEWIAVGGTVVPTFDSGQTATRGLRLILYPIPDDQQVIHYSYVRRHPELSATTDTLDGVPEHIIDNVVQLTTATMLMTTREADANLSALNLRFAGDAVREKHRKSKADKGRRFVLRSLDKKGRRDDFDDRRTFADPNTVV